ncbi:rhodanese-like domain-containing protein, partial [Ramlibacter alkalitolerans]
PVDPALRDEAAADARAVAQRAGVRVASAQDLRLFLAEAARTTYLFDVRTPEEFEAGHLPGFRSTPGGQLVQETDHAAPVRGARIVLVDDDGVRANMTGSWLAQMGWETWVLQATPADFTERGPVVARTPEPQGPLAWITPLQLAEGLHDPSAPATAVLDFSPSARYVTGHVPGAWFVLRSQLAQALQRLGGVQRCVLTCGDSALARHAASEVGALCPGAQVRVLEGGNAAWTAAGLPLEAGETRLASPRIDRYRRPYEGTQASRAAMQAYLDWEFGLVAQLARDATHGFRVI